MSRESSRRAFLFSAPAFGGGYVRPADWLPLAMPTEESIVVLAAVLEQGGRLEVSFATGITVDWGDGSAPQHINAYTLTTHVYDWLDLAPSTLTSRGYRQAIITITPDVELVDAYFETFYGGVRFLDLAVQAPSLTSLQLPGPSWLERLRIGPNSIVTLGNLGGSALQELEIDATTITGLLATAGGMTSVEMPQGLVDICSGLLTQVQGLAGAGWRNVVVSFPVVTSLADAFGACRQLATIRIPDAGVCTNFSGMFNQCDILELVDIDTSAGTNFSNMFNSCYQLRSVNMDTSAGINFNSMFNGCPCDPSNLDFGAAETMYGFMWGGGPQGGVTVDAPNCIDYKRAFSSFNGTSVTLNASSADTSDIQDPDSGTFAGVFSGAGQLTSVTLIGATQVFTGPKIGCDYTALTHSALVYIINHLQNRSVGFTLDVDGAGVGYGVLDVSEVVAAATLTVAEVAVATARRWKIWDGTSFITGI